MTVEMTTRDLWMRHTGVDGQSYVAEHRVWDAERFVAAQQRAAANLNAQQKPDQPRLAKAEQITEEQYRKEKTK